jgi:hypothetical protein
MLDDLGDSEISHLAAQARDQRARSGRPGTRAGLRAPCTQHLLQTWPADIFEHEEQLVLRIGQIEKTDDTRVVKTRAGEMGGNALDGYLHLETQIAGEQDFAHSSFTQNAKNFVAAGDEGVWGGAHGLGLCVHCRRSAASCAPERWIRGRSSKGMSACRRTMPSLPDARSGSASAYFACAARAAPSILCV